MESCNHTHHIEFITSHIYSFAEIVKVASLSDSTSNIDPTKKSKPLFSASNYVSQISMNAMLTNKL